MQQLFFNIPLLGNWEWPGLTVGVCDTGTGFWSNLVILLILIFILLPLLQLLLILLLLLLLFFLHQDLSYGEILAGQPEAWLLKKKKKKFYACNHKISKGLHTEIQNNFQNMFRFYDSFSKSHGITFIFQVVQPI